LFPEGKQMETREQIRRRHRRPLVGSVVLGAAALALAAVRIAATASTDDSSSGTTVVECRGGIVTDGDVQTSSLLVTRVPAGEHPDAAGDCNVQTR